MCLEWICDWSGERLLCGPQPCNIRPNVTTFSRRTVRDVLRHIAANGGVIVYHRIVVRIFRGIFARINEGDFEPMVKGLAPRFTYIFYGDHALSGERHTHAAMRLWWQRVFKILPDAQFEPLDILVKGWPWSTRVASRVAVRGSLPDGSSYENVMHQFMRLRWGRVTEVYTVEDTEKLRRALDTVAAAGIDEANAPPIQDSSHG